MNAVHLCVGLPLSPSGLPPEAFADDNRLVLNAFPWACNMDVPPGGVASRLESGQWDSNLDTEKE